MAKAVRQKSKPKAKAKAKSERAKAQYERFKETAHQLGVCDTENGEKFERDFKKIVSQSKT